MNIIEWDGSPITEPGIYANIPISTYHGPLVAKGWSVSRSGLWKLFDKSPAHAFDVSCYNEDRDPDAEKESEPLLLGRAAHHLILGEADFNSHFIIRPETYPEGAEYPSMIGAPKPWSGNSRWCKAWMADQKARNLTVLTGTQVDNIGGMARGLLAHPMVRAGILNGYVEHTIIVRDPDSGLWLKVRPDVIPNDSGDYADLKTSAGVTDHDVEEAIGRDGLFMQAGMTAWACRLLPEPIELQTFSFVFAEKTRPNCARVRTLKPHELEFGETCARAAAKMWANCMKRSVWPGPGGTQTDAEYVELKPYHRRRLEDRLRLLENEL